MFAHRTSFIGARLCAFLLLLLTTFSAANSYGQSVKKKKPLSDPLTCSNGESLPAGGDGTQDVKVVGPGICYVGKGTYGYRNINVFMGGTLQFKDEGDVDLWAANILIERDGTMIAGSPEQPYGANGTLTIHLFGKDQGTAGDGGVGVACQYPVSDDNPACGVPKAIWNMNMAADKNPQGCTKFSQTGLPSDEWYGPDDCFYQYMPLTYDGGSPTGYFGYKVLGVSYGATLKLFGLKGATYGDVKASDSGTSWARLNVGIGENTPRTLTLNKLVDWKPGDYIVLSGTDYLPSHSELLMVGKNDTSQGYSVISLAYDAKPKYSHNGTTYSLDGKGIPDGVGPDQDPAVTCSPGQKKCIDTRAAVGLLTRSIRILGESNRYAEKFPSPASCSSPGGCYYFGAHTVFRQGFKAVQIQGVEFHHMGQGGRIMHYPVHFHMARWTPQPAQQGDPAVTFVKDSSIWDSMTRWITLHGTQGVDLERNVGFMSIGAGYYLEDGTETDNVLNSNLGVMARAAIDNPQNPRRIPPILGTDVGTPTVFWATNGWNDFRSNMASGAFTCGMCYWLVPAAVSGDSAYEYWSSYAGEQQGFNSQDDGRARAGITPLRTFTGNSCSTAQYSFSTVDALAPCYGIEKLNPIPNPLTHNDPPLVPPGASRQATKCDDENCRTVRPCAYSDDGQQEKNCMITSLDHYTTSFHWAETNVSAVWLRKQWYLFSNSAVTDVLNGGLTFVSGGGYTGADEVPGYWALAHKDVFVGNTQKLSPFASNAGPFVPNGVKCDTADSSFCANLEEGVTFPLGNFGVNQRLFSIYDGPAYQADNAYLDISTTPLTNCTQTLGGSGCSDWAAARQTGIPWDPRKQQCYLPNAAIAWKQPNGFYYPPAFRSSGLFFHNVGIRHFVIEPLFEDGTFDTNVAEVNARYCLQTGAASGLFHGFTDIDRQTELSDDDGSVTGLLGPMNPITQQNDPTISVNKDAFFSVPLETAECSSDIDNVMPPPLGTDCPYKDGSGHPNPALCATANTSPYEYVTTVAFPNTTDGVSISDWSRSCGDYHCYGVPLYREDRNYNEAANGSPNIRMMAQETYQRSNLTANLGRYYIDTTVSAAQQRQWYNDGRGPCNGTCTNVFQPGGQYYVFLLFAKPTTKQTYDLWVGPDFKPDTMLQKVRVNQEPNPPTFTPSGSFQCKILPKDQCASGDECCYDSSSGYLTVRFDLTGAVQEFQDSEADRCKPDSFCSWDASTKSCGCNKDQSSASFAECDNTCKNWAPKDIRCPNDASGKPGCYGFSFSLPQTFTTSNPPKPRPQFSCYPQDFNVQFVLPNSSGWDNTHCDYKGTAPGPAQFCKDGGSLNLLNSGLGWGRNSRP